MTKASPVYSDASNPADREAAERVARQVEEDLRRAGKSDSGSK